IARAVEDRAVEILVERNHSGIECGKGKIVSLAKLFLVEMECFGSGTSRVMVPAVREDDAADIPELCGDFKQRLLFATFSLHYPLGRAGKVSSGRATEFDWAPKVSGSRVPLSGASQQIIRSGVAARVATPEPPAAVRGRPRDLG